MNCENYKKLIGKYLDGSINDAERTALRAHTQECASCCAQVHSIDRIDSTIKSAFCPATATSQASDSILSKLPATAVRWAPRPLFTPQTALAASILLVIGLLLGIGATRITAKKRPSAKAAPTVPIRVASLRGTVLVKHQNSQSWYELTPESNVYLGDTFHSAAKSAFVLELEDKSTIELNQNSMLVLKLYNGGTQFHLEHGRLAATLDSPHPPFVISTPNGRVEALGTEFTVTVE